MSDCQRPTLLIATANVHKFDEMKAILAGIVAERAVALISAAEFSEIESPEETGVTFAANALLKARHYARASGLLTLADDSGLVIDALDGRPGVRSARYAATPEARILRVLAEMRDVPESKRGARFECVIALADAQAGEACFHGEVRGRITDATRGRGGFGYDPIFELIEPPHAGRVMAELSAEEKNSLSHRGRALAAAAATLRQALATGSIPAASRARD